MSSDPTITPPPVDTTSAPVLEPPRVKFSGPRWFFTGIVRLLYRGWTHIAARLFPEDSASEHIALDLHIPLPDRLNMSWVTDNLAVGGRVRPEDIKALARAGITHVIDTRSEYADDPQAMAREHIELLHIPAADTQPFNIEQMLEGARWAYEHIQRGGRAAQCVGLNRPCCTILSVACCDCSRHRHYSGRRRPHRRAPAHRLQHGDIVVIIPQRHDLLQGNIQLSCKRHHAARL